MALPLLGPAVAAGKAAVVGTPLRAGITGGTLAVLPTTAGSLLPGPDPEETEPETPDVDPGMLAAIAAAIGVILVLVFDP